MRSVNIKYSQMTFFEFPPTAERVVNVASVPQRSPFRYPGGKTWLVPRIREWMSSFSFTPTHFIEPFAGGGIAGLTVAFEKLADRVILVEIDEHVASVWQTILSDDCEWLIDQILTFDLTLDNLKAELSREARSTKRKAFQTILKNRTYHGGILAPGSRPIKFGENGKGIKSRWYPQTLARRIKEINAIKDRIQFVKGDGIEVIRSFNRCKRAAYFVDPPYTAAGKKAGKRLYVHNQLDHEILFYELSKAKGEILITYDDAEEVENLAKRFGFCVQKIAMKNTHHAYMDELLIGRDMHWLK